MSTNPRLALERMVLWVGSATDGSAVSFPHGSNEGGALVSYVNSAGAPHPQPEKQRLPNQPMSLAVWFPARELAPEAMLEAFADRFTASLGERRVVTHFMAAYEPTGKLDASSTRSDYAGLMVGATDCVDPDQLESFQAWYDEVHAAEALAPGIFETGRRYRRLGPPGRGCLPTETASEHNLPAPEFIALYESERPGAEAVAELVTPENRPPSPLHPSCRIRGFWAFDRQLDG